jgi:hypothetical protein
MPEIRVAANYFGLGEGHLQIVYVDDSGNQKGITVTVH